MGKCGYNGGDMDSITLKNYRCFAGEQTARLAPLTLLVGENSTGKTSFLAMVRALWDATFGYDPPNFRDAPYDLGAFEDIVHNSGGGRGKLADSFEAGFSLSPQPQLENGAMSVHATFKERQGAPFPTKRRIEGKGVWIEAQAEEDRLDLIFGTPCSKWRRLIDVPIYGVTFPLFFAAEIDIGSLSGIKDGETPDEIDSSPTKAEIEELTKLVQALSPNFGAGRRPFASAPVRSRPRRTYDPIQQLWDTEGEHIPSYLANLYRQDADGWQKLKASLEEFGRKSGLFDDISVRSFGNTGGAPFQIQVRKWGKRRKGLRRNLIDVGYGVSQALLLVTELLRPDAPYMFLLQQPEVHLHPSAQAALGSLFCDVAARRRLRRRQLVIETHSDYIIDRVRMDVRDGATGLKPEDVSILYFERDELAVNIHSMTIDEQGDLLDAPPNYRQFFTNEMRRAIGF